MSAPTATDIERHTVAFRRGSLAVLRAGEGPTVGYLHGMIGNPAAAPTPVVAELAGSHRVIAPSLPGFTGSDPCDDLRTMFDWVVATSEIIDLCGLAGAPMVATSVGAMLALELAAVRPEAFSRLVLVAPLGLWVPEAPVADAFGTSLSEQRGLLTADPSVTAAFFDEGRGDAALDAVEQGVHRYLTRTAAAALVWPIPEHGLDTRLHRVSCPVTLVWGSEDRLVPSSYAERFAAAIDGPVDVHTVAGAGHLADWDAPGEVAALVRAALS